MKYPIWKRGRTLITAQTKRWSKEEMEENNKIEKSIVFSDFTSYDEGRSRKKVCLMNELHPDYESNAKLIEATPRLLSFVESFIREFETDYLHEGEIVDNPNTLLIQNYKEAKELINSLKSSI